MVPVGNYVGAAVVAAPTASGQLPTVRLRTDYTWMPVVKTPQYRACRSRTCSRRWGGIFETYFAQQHHITALISGQTPGHSIENFAVWPAASRTRTSRATTTSGAS